MTDIEKPNDYIIGPAALSIWPILTFRLWTWFEDISLLWNLNKKNAEFLYRTEETTYRIHDGFDNQTIFGSLSLVTFVAIFVTITIIFFVDSRYYHWQWWLLWFVSIILVIYQLTFVILFAKHKKYSHKKKTKILIAHILLKPVTFWLYLGAIALLYTIDKQSEEENK